MIQDKLYPTLINQDEGTEVPEEGLETPEEGDISPEAPEMPSEDTGSEETPDEEEI